MLIDYKKPIRDFLRKRPQDYEGEPVYFWMDNTIYVKNATKNLIKDLAKIAEIRTIRLEDHSVTLDVRNIQHIFQIDI
ncbi:unnamed protein product [Adineta steineri]|uniref:Uncharacterized protein n=1 Tax=Adineta steineri TaxID=433720 RepID=A0A815M1S9_9BILA|nr:unnamed protein product [Adineta steineri]CAF1618967.1 unnamed protein product [Adineta steineri]